MDDGVWFLIVFAILVILYTFYPSNKGTEGYIPEVITPNYNSPSPSPVNTSPPVDIRYWPGYFYTFPYLNNYGDWPPDMLSRQRFWYPGYSSGTGWGFELRPGVYNKAWPRNRWVRTNGGHYTINNGYAPNDPYSGRS